MPRTRRRIGRGRDSDTGTDVDFRWCHDDAWSPYSTGREEPEHTDQEKQFVAHRLLFLSIAVDESPCGDCIRVALSVLHAGKIPMHVVPLSPEKRFPLWRKCVILGGSRGEKSIPGRVTS
jgi:hypothetical protein